MYKYVIERSGFLSLFNFALEYNVNLQLEH